MAGLVFCPTLLLFAAENPTLAIKVDQVGYLPGGPKIALVSGPAKTFEIRRSSDGKPVFHGVLGPVATDPLSGDAVQAADFSQLRRAGSYYIQIPGVGKSWNFSVGSNVFGRTWYLAMRGFYGQRCGTAVDLGPEFPGYSHPACHLSGEFHPSSGKSGPRDNIGGWHDAGDYGRYMVNSGVATGTLLWAWEIYGPRLKSIQLRIPETGNGTPDILNEVRWNLEWMLKMQDTDGGAWHKQTSTHFPGFIAPDKDTLPSEVIGTGSAPYKSTCATADLAAVAAIAARDYKPYDPQFAARALDAARHAWQWTEQYPNVTFRNPPGITTGEYGDSNCSDERLWAAAELWRTTGEAAYHQFFLKNYAAYLPVLDSPSAENWSMMAPMALRTYVLFRRKGADAKAKEAIRNRMLTAARAIVESTADNPYHVSLKSTDFVWGSNGIAAQYGVDLMIANVIAPNPEFVNTARDDLHYLLGRNTFSRSWVTQVGEHSVMHPHHRPSGSGEQPGPWPGLMSGGPNAGRQDAVLAALPAGLPPEKVYADQTASYASNEIAINWQANLVFLLAGQLH
ncbi:MAG: glycoside hydrolase family 9 protein [Terracidiphilus sp.]